MTETTEESTGVWRPLIVRGVPLHIALPVVTALVAFALLASGGLLAVLGGWILTVGVSLAIGAFLNDPRALAAPAALWGTWLLIVAISGSTSSLPRTPVLAAVVFAALGAACVWLGQRAVQPAVDRPRSAVKARGVASDLDELLTPEHDPADSLSLDPAAEVDDALADLLDDDGDDLDELLPASDDEPVAVDPPGSASEEPLPPATPDAATEDAASEDADDDSGHVIEFAALTDADLEEVDEPPLPAATEAGRRSPDG